MPVTPETIEIIKLFLMAICFLYFFMVLITGLSNFFSELLDI